MKILFLCVANSARSQMAEGLAKELLGEKATVESAGSAPSKINPFAIKAMKEIGIDITAQFSKSVDTLQIENYDKIVTLCADEVCPMVSSSVDKQHWPLEDPAAAEGNEEEILQSFRKIRDQILRKLQQELATS